MKKHLDAKDKINSIKLELRHPSTKKQIWLLVEGEDDVKIYTKLIENYNVKVEHVFGGVENLKIAVEELIKETNRVIGIRDADFINLNNEHNDIHNLFITDYHDIEMLMISSDRTFQSLIFEYLPSYGNILDIRMKILDVISFVGGIRYYNYINNLKLNFDGISFESFFDCQTLEINNFGLVDNINVRSKNKIIEIDYFSVEEFIPSNIDLYNLCNGHDFEQIVSLFIKCKNNNRNIKYKDIGKALRLSYNIEEFKKTNLYQNLKNWEIINSLELFKN